MQLVHELTTNQCVISELSTALTQVPKSPNHVLYNAILNGSAKLAWDRYDFYLDKEHGTIYEMDPFGSVEKLRKILGDLIELGKRCGFPEAESRIHESQECSNKMIRSLTKRPRHPVLIDK